MQISIFLEEVSRGCPRPLAHHHAGGPRFGGGTPTEHLQQQEGNEELLDPPFIKKDDWINGALSYNWLENLRKYNTPPATNTDIIDRLKDKKLPLCIVLSDQKKSDQKKWELYQLSMQDHSSKNILLQEYTAEPRSNCIWSTIPRGTTHACKCINGTMRNTDIMLFLTKSNNDNGFAIADFTEEQAKIGEEVPTDFLNLWKSVNNTNTTKRFGMYYTTTVPVFAKIDRYRMQTGNTYVLSRTGSKGPVTVKVRCTQAGRETEEFDLVEILECTNDPTLLEYTTKKGTTLKFYIDLQKKGIFEDVHPKPFDINS